MHLKERRRRMRIHVRIVRVMVIGGTGEDLTACARSGENCTGLKY